MDNRTVGLVNFRDFIDECKRDLAKLSSGIKPSVVSIDHFWRDLIHQMVNGETESIHFTWRVTYEDDVYQMPLVFDMVTGFYNVDDDLTKRFVVELNNSIIPIMEQLRRHIDNSIELSIARALLMGSTQARVTGKDTDHEPPTIIFVKASLYGDLYTIRIA